MVERRIKDFNDAMIMDAGNVGAIFKLKESFEDTKKIDWFEKSLFKNYEWNETDWNKVSMDVEQEKYVCKRTLISKAYVDWFINICKAFFKQKIDIKDLILYEDKRKDHPVLITYSTLGIFIAPRVDYGDDFDFKDHKETIKEIKKNKTKTKDDGAI